jgi:hypothetical protein
MYLQKVISRKTFFLNKFFVFSMTKIAGSGSESISQRLGSRDPDPDPHQNVMDPLHCLEEVKNFFSATLLKCMYFERHQT